MTYKEPTVYLILTPCYTKEPGTLAMCKPCLGTACRSVARGGCRGAGQGWKHDGVNRDPFPDAKDRICCGFVLAFALRNLCRVVLLKTQVETPRLPPSQRLTVHSRCCLSDGMLSHTETHGWRLSWTIGCRDTQLMDQQGFPYRQMSSSSS